MSGSFLVLASLSYIPPVHFLGHPPVVKWRP